MVQETGINPLPTLLREDEGGPCKEFEQSLGGAPQDGPSTVAPTVSVEISTTIGEHPAPSVPAGRSSAAGQRPRKRSWEQAGDCRWFKISIAREFFCYEKMLLGSNNKTQ
ncbi:hypothetical protein SUGI_0863730 [Cryptomeria japonica]|nr:hypothetical protein SUGI_0863730 [Cryptomeria japonica]